MWGSPRRAWRRVKGPWATRYTRHPRWMYHGQRLYCHYRTGNFILHRDLIG